MGIMTRYRTAKLMANAMFERMKNDESGETPVKAIVTIFIVSIMAGALLPTGISALKAANTTEWSTSEVATYGIISIMLIIAVILLVVRIANE